MQTGYRTNAWTAAAVTLALASLATACGGDDDGGATIAPSTRGDDAGAPTGKSESPVYALVTTPATSGGAPPTSYLLVTDALTGDLPITKAVREFPGNAIAAGPVGGKRLFVGTSTSGELKRYDLEDDGTLADSGSVNFQAAGVASFASYASSFQFVSPTKAYYYAWQGKIVVFDPEALTVTGQIDLPQTIRKDPANPNTNLTSSVTGAPLRIGDKIYFFVSWDSRTSSTIKMFPESAIVVLDTKTDTAAVVVDDGGCAARDGIVEGDFIYLVTENAATSAHYLAEANGPRPCIRRFNTVTQQYDAAYKVDLTALAGAPAGSLVVSPNKVGIVYVLDRASADPNIGSGAGKINNPRLLAVGQYWKPVKLTVGDTPKVEPLNLPLASGSVLPLVLNSTFKVTATFGMMPEMREVTDQGVVATPRANAKLYGSTGSLVQLR